MSRPTHIHSTAEYGLIESDSGPELGGPIPIDMSSQVNIGLYNVVVELVLVSVLSLISTDPDSETESDSEVDAFPTPNINLVKTGK